MKYGLIDGYQELTAYLLGGAKVPFIDYVEDGNWEKFLPKYEPQAEDYETSGCTVWGMQNQVEIFHKGIYGSEPNYSERYNYLLAPVTPKYGANPQLAYESVRKHGLIDHDLLPVPKTLDEFLDSSKITGSLLAKGQYWLARYELKHEWLWDTKQKPPKNALELMKWSLHTSPLGISVSAWYEENGKFIDNGQKNNHWCVCYKIDEDGIHVFDSYDHSRKILSLNHNISKAKRIWLNKKGRAGSKRQISILKTIINMLTQKKSFLDICKEHLGQDASPNDIAPDELACAETVTTLLKKAYPDVPIISGTYTLWEYLKDSRNGFVQVFDDVAETIIISPTGTGKRGAVGHVGVFDDNGLIMSNNSLGLNKGKFTQNYTRDTWEKRYVEKQGMPIYLYRRVV